MVILIWNQPYIWQDGVITLWIPYGEQPVDFYKAGLEAILDKHFKDNYKIEYE